jgi:hypothetical protein
MDPVHIETAEGAPGDIEESQEKNEFVEADTEKCPESSEATSQPGSTSVPLSKNQQKKLAKQQRFKEAKTAKKAAKKEEKKRERDERKTQDHGAGNKRPKREDDQESGHPNKPSRNGQKRAFVARKHPFSLFLILNCSKASWMP